MANVWVLSKLKGVFGSGKKAAVAEATKSFDESKETIDKEFEEKKDELKPKTLEIYEAAPAAIKALLKSPTEAGLKKNSSGVAKFLGELAKTGFPGSDVVSKAASKFGPALIPGPIIFIFEKVSSLIPDEETPAATELAAETRELKLEDTKKEEAEKVEETPTETSVPAEPAAEPAKADEPPAEAEGAPVPAKA